MMLMVSVANTFTTEEQGTEISLTLSFFPGGLCLALFAFIQRFFTSFNLCNYAKFL